MPVPGCFLLNVSRLKWSLTSLVHVSSGSATKEMLLFLATHHHNHTIARSTTAQCPKLGTATAFSAHGYEYGAR
jgi:hypothetical protein